MSDGERVHAFAARWLDEPHRDAIGARNDLAETLEEVRLDERRAIVAWLLDMATDAADPAVFAALHGAAYAIAHTGEAAS